MPDIWIQLENRPWDTMPNNIDRMTGKNAHTITTHASQRVTITSPGTGVTKNRRMCAPLRDITAGNIMDALIFRRYKVPLLPDQSEGKASQLLKLKIYIL